jgi:uncharacterized protein DUF6580
MNVESSEKETVVVRTVVILAMVVLAAVLRIAPHPWNLAPIGAMALFSGAMVKDRRLAFLFPLLALFAGDVFIGLHKLIPIVYASFLINVFIGRFLEDNRTVARIGGATFLAALQFFVITNFAVWAFLGSFPFTPAGLVTCYVNGLPLFWNTLAGDALYATLLFGGFALAERTFPALRQQTPESAR